MVEETYFEYDMEQLKSMVQTGAISYAITLFLHIKWGYIPPLILQALLSVKKATEQPLFLIYVAGQSEAKKELQRPFKQVSLELLLLHSGKPQRTFPLFFFLRYSALRSRHHAHVSFYCVLFCFVVVYFSLQPDMNPFKSFMPDSMDPEKQAEKKAKQAVKKTKRSDRAPLVN